MAENKQSRRYLTIGATVLVALGLAYAFWPKPTLVDIDTVTRGLMRVTVDEEGRTQIRQRYVISAPASGRLARVTVEAGDPVEAGMTVARLLPASPPVLDIRDREIARQSVRSAEAGVASAQADLVRAKAAERLAKSRLERAEAQSELGTISDADLEQVRQTATSAQATLGNRQAELMRRNADLSSARAALMDSADDRTEALAAIPVAAPVTGRVLRVMQESETVVAAGAPVMEIGNIEDDLEVIVELLSSSAVLVQAGDQVLIENWGGDETIEGEVKRIEPQAFTKISALGVEEQRVNATIELPQTTGTAQRLGDGYRVDARIVIWEKEDAVIVPASALFRTSDEWTVFAVDGNKARRRTVQIERNNGTLASVTDGLQADEQVILYPSSDLEDGTRVARR